MVPAPRGVGTGSGRRVHHGVVEATGNPTRTVHASAPVRICDVGGWTDTWFAGHGTVFNIGVRPGVEVEVRVQAPGTPAGRVVIDAVDVGDRYAFEPGAPPGRLPLLEATIDEIGVPAGTSVEITVSSAVPPGSAMGTSASVTVALVAALDALTTGRLTDQEIASVAHSIESDRLGLQSGVQDQLCAAFGGVSLIEVPTYPRAVVTRVVVPDAVWRELDRRLVVVSLGRGHVSSAVHDQVIAALASAGGGTPQLEVLRRCAGWARDAVLAADFAALGRVMVRSTGAQGDLHPDLVSPEAEAVFDVAAAYAAAGWKVNGAGGDGGSVTVLCGPDPGARRRMVDALCDADPRFEVLPVRLSRDGVRVASTPT